MSLTLATGAALLFGIGTWLLLQRRLSRIIIGLGLISHGANLLLVTSGRGGLPAFLSGAPDDPDRYVDPLPQAMLLTAIVISFGVTAFLLAMAWRSFVLTGDDLVEDDREDRRVARERDAALDEEVVDTELTGERLASAKAGMNPDGLTDAALARRDEDPGPDRDTKPGPDSDTKPGADSDTKPGADSQDDGRRGGPK